MHALAEIVKSVEKDGDTWLVVRLPKSRLKEDPAQRFLMMQSSPIVIPSRVNAALCATVV